MSSLKRTHFWNPAASKAFILDWDGVLAETKLSFAHIRHKYFQGKFVPLFESIATLPHEVSVALERDIYDEEMRGAESAEAVPGALELLEWLENERIPWCVVSRNCLDSIRLAAERSGLSLPELVFSRDHPPVKPAPEALWRAAEDMLVPAADCLMVGDFVYDLVGARRAGMRAVLVQRPGAEWAFWADASFDTLIDFVELLKSKTPLLPWEYKNLLLRSNCGEDLESLSSFVLTVAASRVDILNVCMEHAARGILNFIIEGEETLAPEQWFLFPGLSPIWLDRPLREVLQHLLDTRYPLAGLLGDVDGYTELLPDAKGELEGFY